jgi:biotin transporter BioY
VLGNSPLVCAALSTFADTLNARYPGVSCMGRILYCGIGAPVFAVGKTNAKVLVDPATRG